MTLSRPQPYGQFGLIHPAHLMQFSSGFDCYVLVIQPPDPNYA